MFTPDSRTEAFLRHNGVRFDYRDRISFAALNKHWRENNLGRREAIDSDAVNDYAHRMLQQSAAPAIIVIESHDGFHILDGVQRASSAESVGETSFCAYVVDPNTSTAKQHLIRIGANSAINGPHNPDTSFVLEEAVNLLYFADGCSVEEIARAIGRTPSVVEEEISFQITSRRIQSVGYTGILCTRQRKWFIDKVAKYSDESDFGSAPVPLLEYFRDYEECGFVNGSSEHLVRDVFDVDRSPRANRDAQFRKKLEKFRNDPQVRELIASPVKQPKVRQLLPQMKGVITVINQAVDNGEFIHDGNFAAQIADHIKDIIDCAKKLVPADLQVVNGKKNSLFKF